MKEIRKAVISLASVVLIILFISGLEILTGKVVLVTERGALVQENEITKIEIFPKVVKLEKIAGFVIKDKIGVEVEPGSSGVYKEVVFFRKGSSEIFEEFNLKCDGFKCRDKVTGYQTIDNKWKTGEYIARVKDAQTREYVYTDFSVENNL